MKHTKEKMTPIETIKFILQKHGHRDIKDGTFKHIEEVLTLSHIAILENEVEELERMKVEETPDIHLGHPKMIGFNRALEDRQQILREEIKSLQELIKTT